MNETYALETEELIRELPKGLLGWYAFRPGAKALYIPNHCRGNGLQKGTEPLFELLGEKGLQAYALEAEDLNVHTGNYDYVIFSRLLETQTDPVNVIRQAKRLLKEDGVLLFGMNNRLGIRYFCGDRDEFTGRNFDSIENYSRIDFADRSSLGGKAYSMAEMRRILKDGGTESVRFYSVFPTLYEPQFLFAEDVLPNEELDVRIFPAYDHPETVFLEEANLYRTMSDNGLFHSLANAYLVECPMQGKFSPARSITVSVERGKRNALSTIIMENKTVVKRPVYPEGAGKAQELFENADYLRRHGIKVISETINGLDYEMPFVEGESAVSYFRRLLCEDEQKLYAELDRFYDLILHSSGHVAYEEIDWDRFEPGREDRPQKQKADDPNKGQWAKLAASDDNAFGVILKRGYIDLVALNCFVTGQDFVFYDQEYYAENVPARAILLRTINFIYMRHPELKRILPKERLLARYDLQDQLKLYQKFSNRFIAELKNKTVLDTYRKAHQADPDLLTLNRQRMNYSQTEYERIFRDIFRNTEGRDLYLFGAGNYARKFISQFADDYKIAGLIDNNEENCGRIVDGIEVFSSEILKSLKEGRYKIIICIRNYVPVMKQLEELGLHNYSVYDWSLPYPRKAKPLQEISHAKEEGKKKYHIGYVAGVFDLFHIGHVNLLRRAKEQCDYLIVGVVTDEQVRNVKRTTPYMPFEDRIGIVRSCRYVDEAVEIPKEYYTTKEAYRRYQFDVQFSGSDYENDPGWLKNREFLRSNGADLVFFPYTESTSSTKLKQSIRDQQTNK